MTKLATVTAVTSTGVTVRFDGETTASSRTYRTLRRMLVGERAVMIRVGSTYVCAGSISVAADDSWTNVANTVAVGAVQYRRNGDSVAVWTGGTAATASGTTYTLTTTALPDVLRPDRQWRAPCSFDGYPGAMVVTTAGHVLIAQLTGANRGTWEGSTQYPLK